MPTLTQKIQKAIPELMELREGCVLEAKVEKGLYYKIVQIKLNIFQTCEIGNPITLILEKNEIESMFTIIGHEPQLNHVLKYLEIKSEESGTHYAIDSEGYFLEKNALSFNLWSDTLHRWNLESNLLKDQPKPLIEWLDKIE